MLDEIRATLVTNVQLALHPTSMRVRQIITVVGCFRGGYIPARFSPAPRHFRERA